MRKIIKTTYSTECREMVVAPKNNITLHAIVENVIKEVITSHHPGLRPLQIWANCDLFRPTFTGRAGNNPIEGSYNVTNGKLLVYISEFVMVD